MREREWVWECVYVTETLMEYACEGQCVRGEERVCVCEIVRGWKGTRPTVVSARRLIA